MDIKNVVGDYKNFVFIGGAGSGKSELALNFALWLKNEYQSGECHFFDLDMTKPLFRSRDLDEYMKSNGISMHFQEQFMDAPTMIGGVRPMLKNSSLFTVLDIGGDFIGARSIGGFQNELNRNDTKIFYVLNAFRPWTSTIEHIDETLGKILGVSHIKLEKLSFINNSNLGAQTSSADFINATLKLEKILEPHVKIEFSTVHENIYGRVSSKQEPPIYPIHLYLNYSWNVE